MQDLFNSFDFNSFDACQDQLTKEIVDAVNAWHDPYPAMFSVTMRDPNNKYMASSAFQKCLRRGFTARAVYYTEAIFNSFEQDYLWNRLPLVVLEDIGLGNWKFCAYAIHFCRFTKVRKSVDTLKALHWLIHHMTEGYKSRALSEAVCFAYFCKHHAPTTEIQYIGDCMAAIGWKPQANDAPHSPWLNKAPDMSRDSLYQEVEELAELYPEDRYYIRYCFHAGSKKNTAYQNAAIPHVLRLFSETGEFEKHDHDVDPLQLIAKYPDVSYDKHTHMGKRANGMILKSGKLPVAANARQLGLCIFQGESAVIDKELTSKALIAMQIRSQEYELEMVDMDVEKGKTLIKYLQAEDGKALLKTYRTKVATGF